MSNNSLLFITPTFFIYCKGSLVHSHLINVKYISLLLFVYSLFYSVITFTIIGYYRGTVGLEPTMYNHVAAFVTISVPFVM